MRRTTIATTQSRQRVNVAASGRLHQLSGDFQAAVRSRSPGEAPVARQAALRRTVAPGADLFRRRADERPSAGAIVLPSRPPGTRSRAPKGPRSHSDHVSAEAAAASARKRRRRDINSLQTSRLPVGNVRYVTEAFRSFTARVNKNKPPTGNGDALPLKFKKNSSGKRQCKIASLRCL